MAVSSAPPAAPPRRLGWRYSLRGLLVVVTLACIGLWYWYRVPFTKVVDHSQQAGYFQRETAGNVHLGRVVQRFRRVLRGEPIREGLTELYDREGRRIGEENWREGSLHGRWIRWYTNGKVRSRGEYRAGRMQGTWEHFEESGQLTLKMVYDEGRPHGDWQQFDEGQVAKTIHFEEGEATHIDGQPFHDPLGHACRLKEIDSGIQEMVLRAVGAEFYGTPLIVVSEFFGEMYGIYFTLDPKCEPDVQAPIRMRLDNVTAGAGLVLILSPLDLVATHRFGMIWITTQEDAANWVDRTGTSKLLETPPADASLVDQQKVRAALEKPAQFDFLDTPVVDIAGYLTDTYGLNFACHQSAAGLALTSSVRGTTLQNALGALCEQHDLRIRWTEGTTLVIERQEEEK